MTYSSTVTGDGAIAYWRMDATGTSAQPDTITTGTACNLTLANFSGYTAAVTGLLAGDSDTAAQFTATSSYLNNASVPAKIYTPGTGSKWTMEAWIKPTAFTQNGEIVRYDDGAGAGYYMRLDTTGKIEIRLNATTVISQTSGTTLSTGTTYHVVCTYDGTTTLLYINGTQTDSWASSTTLSFTSGKRLVIGGNGFNNEQFNGVIDEVALYNVALTSTQVANHHTIGSTSTVGQTFTGQYNVAAVVHSDHNDVFAVLYGTVGQTITPLFDDLVPANRTSTSEWSLLAHVNADLPVTFYTLAVYQSMVTADTPKAYWRMTALTDVDVVSGLTLSPQATSAMSLVAGALAPESNQAVQFGTVNGSCDFSWWNGNGASSALNGTTSFSVEFWAFGPAVSGGHAFTLFSGSFGVPSSATKVIDIGLNGKQFSVSMPQLTGGTANTSVLTMNGSTPSAANYHHFVVTYNSSTRAITLYADGVANGSASPSAGTPLNTSLWLEVADAAFNGSLDEIAFYQHVLTATQVANHYNVGRLASYTVSKELGTYFNVGISNAVGQSITANWTDRANVGQAVTAEWDVNHLPAVGQSVTANWTVVRSASTEQRPLILRRNDGFAPGHLRGVVGVTLRGSLSPVVATLNVPWTFVSAVTLNPLSVQWDAAQLAGQSVTVLSETAEAVGVSLNVPFVVPVTVGGQQTVNWPVLALAGQSRELLWTLVGRIVATLTEIWAVDFATGKSVTPVWLTAADISADLTVVADTLLTVGAEIAADWSMTQLAGAEETSVWTVVQTASADINALWSVAALVNAVLTVSSDTLETGGSTSEHLWLVTALVHADLSIGETFYAVVSAEITAQWNSPTLSKADSAMVWTVSEQAGAEILGSWNVAVVVAAAVEVDWVVALLAGADADLVWPTEAVVGVTADIVWLETLLAGAEIIPQWDTAQVISDDDTELWNTLVTVGAEANIPFTVNALATASLDIEWVVALTAAAVHGELWSVLVVSGQDATVVWAQMALAGAQEADEWLIAETIAAAVEVDWLLTSLAGQDISAIFDDLVPAAQPITVAWTTDIFAAVSLQVTWLADAPVGASLALPFQNNVTLAKTITPLWDTLVTVGAQTTLTWGAGALAGAVTTATFGVRALVNQPSTVTWSDRSLLTVTPTVQWNVAHLASPTTSVLFNDLTSVGRTLTAQWPIRTVVGSQITVVATTYATVGSTFTESWNQVGSVGASLTEVANVQAAVAHTLTGVFNDRQVVGAALTGDWAVAQTVGRASTELWTTYFGPGVGSTIGQNLTPVFQVAQVVGHAEQARWNVLLGTVGASLAVSFDDLIPVAHTFSPDWAVTVAVVTDAIAVWTVIGQARRDATVRFSTRATVNHTFTEVFSILFGTAGSTLSPDWAVRTRTSSTSHVNWNIRAHVDADMHTSFNDDILVGSVLQDFWQTLITAGEQTTVDWRTNGPVGTGVFVDWETRAKVGKPATLNWRAYVTGVAPAGETYVPTSGRTQAAIGPSRTKTVTRGSNSGGITSTRTLAKTASTATTAT